MSCSNSGPSDDRNKSDKNKEDENNSNSSCGREDRGCFVCCGKVGNEAVQVALESKWSSAFMAALELDQLPVFLVCAKCSKDKLAVDDAIKEYFLMENLNRYRRGQPSFIESPELAAETEAFLLKHIEKTVKKIRWV